MCELHACTRHTCEQLPAALHGGCPFLCAAKQMVMCTWCGITFDMWRVSQHAPGVSLQVCGEEGRVEVLLVNTCATPLKLDGLQLQVHPQQQEPHPTPGAAGAGVGTAGDGSNGSSSNAAATQQQQQQRSVSVMLAAGSKPIRVLLSHVPNKAGYVAITGVQVSMATVQLGGGCCKAIPALPARGNTLQTDC